MSLRQAHFLCINTSRLPSLGASKIWNPKMYHHVAKLCHYSPSEVVSVWFTICFSTHHFYIFVFSVPVLWQFCVDSVPAISQNSPPKLAPSPGKLIFHADCELCSLSYHHCYLITWSEL